MVPRTQYVEAGQRFGRLVVKDPDAVIDWPSGPGRGAVCLCECGTEKLIGLRQLLSGRTSSCGCLLREAGPSARASGPKVAQRTLFAEAGQRFGLGVVLDPEVRIMRGTRATRGARLQCDCGTVYEAPLKKLCRGERTSCGCKRAKWDGITKRPDFNVWSNMVSRCENPNDWRYDQYGGRGIAVCEQWHDPRVFFADLDQLLGPRPLGGSLDRVDVDKGYSLDNVRWASQYRQVNNQQRTRRDVVQAREDRRREVFALWQDGNSSLQIAGILGLGPGAVRNDLRWIGQHLIMREDRQRIKSRIPGPIS